MLDFIFNSRRAAANTDSSPQDPISIAIAEGTSRRHAARPCPTQAHARAASLLEEVRAGSDPQRAADNMLRLVRRYPAEERLQLAAARLLETAKHPETTAAWSAILGRFPDSHSIVVETFRRSLRNLGIENARVLLAEHFPSEPSDPARLLLYAQVLDAIRDFEGCDAAIDRLLAASGVKESQILGIVTLYKQRGDLIRARNAVRGGLQSLPANKRLLATLRRLDSEISSFAAILLKPDLDESTTQLDVFRSILEQVGASRSTLERNSRRFVGSVVLVGTSLDAGGAERQLTNTACALADAVNSGERIAGFDIVGPVKVVCRSITNQPGADFFHSDLRAKNVEVEQYARYADFGGSPRRSAASDIGPFLKYLPAPIAEATRKLTDVLRVSSPDVIHIWQDGAIFASYLSALLANVPRIVLSLRTLPPPDRPERNRLEYKVLYRTAAQTPGVSLVVNSKHAAQRFADWLQIDEKKIGVIYNGVAPMQMDADEQTEALEKAFFAGRDENEFVVGSVMRLDENKRPLEWIQVANSILERLPTARFVIVGDGPLKTAALDLAQRLGIADRLLIVGHSRHVGRWLASMSVVLLLSRHEGLPNALIEAQLMGIPVVSTPAGGAAETFRDGETGSLLPPTRTIDFDEVANTVLSWRMPQSERAQFRQKCLEWAAPRFSVDAMIGATVAEYQS